MMKLRFIAFFMAFVPALCFSQSTLHFTYDAAGNRLTRATVAASRQKASPRRTIGSISPEEPLIRVSDERPNILHIDILNLNDAAHITIYTHSGIQYVSTEVHAGSMDIDITRIPKGPYILRIDWREDAEIWKMIKQ